MRAHRYGTWQGVYTLMSRRSKTVYPPLFAHSLFAGVEPGSGASSAFVLATPEPLGHLAAVSDHRALGAQKAGAECVSVLVIGSVSVTDHFAFCRLADIDYIRCSLWLVATQRFLSRNDVILPRRPLSVRRVPDSEAARLAIRRQRWKAEAEHILDPAVLSLFSRRGADDGTPVTNPLSEESQLMSGATPVDNDDAEELLQQVRWCLVGMVLKVCGAHTGNGDADFVGGAHRHGRAL